MKLKKIAAGIGSLAIALTAVLVPDAANNLPSFMQAELTASAADTSGVCGENLAWQLSSNGVLTISGTGDMADNISFTTDIKEKTVKVVIKDGVTSIGKNAFMYCQNLTGITIPDSVTSIGISAFYGCENLESITIPDSVKSIGVDAFSMSALLKNQTGLKYVDKWLVDCDYDDISVSVDIKEGTKGLANSLFYHIKNLTSITIPDSVANIGSSTFYDCENLESINVSEKSTYYKSQKGILFDVNMTELIKYPSGLRQTTYAVPDSVNRIGSSAFLNCTSLKSITIPNGVTSIGDYTFSDCTSLESINIPDSVTSIGDSAFSDCTVLKSITIPDGVTSIGKRTFLCCKSLESITVPGSVKSIGTEAFHLCTSLESAVISEGVTSIGNESFSNCTNLSSVTIPNSAASICFGAFGYCDSLDSITIPGSVTNIDGYAFYACKKLKSITILNPACEIFGDGSTIFNENNNSSFIFNGTIYGYENSTAQKYAEKCSYKFESIGKYITGDVSCDGKITVADVVLMQKALINKAGISSVMDLNNDGQVNVFDVIILKRKLLGVAEDISTPGMTWQKAYIYGIDKYINEKCTGDSSKTPECALIYIDDDEIPELYLTYFNDINVYTFDDDLVLFSEGGIRNNGLVDYKEKMGIFVTHSSGSMYDTTMRVYEFKNFKSTMLKEFVYNKNAVTEEVTYTIDGKNVTEDEYKKQLAEYDYGTEISELYSADDMKKLLSGDTSVKPIKNSDSGRTDSDQTI